MSISIPNDLVWNYYAGIYNSGNPFSGTLVISASFQFNSQQTPIYLAAGSIFNGNYNTITFNYSLPFGLIVCPTSGTLVTIQNLYINTLFTGSSANNSMLIYNIGSNDGQICNISNIFIYGTNQPGTSTSCPLLGNNFGNTTLSTISYCYVLLLLAGGTTGGCGFGNIKSSANVTFNYCYYNYSSANSGNGFCNALGTGSTVTFNSCYSSTRITTSQLSGFVKDVTGSTVSFNKCYLYNNGGTFASNSGGFIARVLNSSTSVINFTDCYSICVAGSGGGFIGASSSSAGTGYTITFTRCYSASNGNALIAGTTASVGTGIINITDCHIRTLGNFPTSAGSVTVTTTSSANDLDVNTSYTNWNTSTWTINASDYPLLHTFEDTTIWDGTYTLTTSIPNFSSLILFASPAFFACFSIDTLIQSNKGNVKIQELMKGDIVDGYEIETIKSSPSPNSMIKIEKDSLDINLPENDIIVTDNHVIKYNDKFYTASDLCKLNSFKIYSIQSPSANIYHIVLKNGQHAFINVNGLKMETFK